MKTLLLALTLLLCSCADDDDYFHEVRDVTTGMVYAAMDIKYGGTSVSIKTPEGEWILLPRTHVLKITKRKIPR